MATVDKNFKVKHGLIVEGTTATVNGEDIITTGNTTDDIAEGSANLYFTDARAAAAVADEIATAVGDAVGALDTDDVAEGTNLYFTAERAQQEAQNFISNYLPVGPGSGVNVGSYIGPTGPATLSIDRTTVDAWYDAAGAASAAQTAAESYADGLASNYDAAGAAATAESNANSYTDTALEDYTPTSGLDAAVGGYGYLKSADLSAYATETYVGTAVSNAVDGLVDGAPGLLDTLNEIAAAINDDANYATTMTTALAGKQDELTAGANIDITADVISVTGLDSADISDFNTAALSATASAYDAAGSAAAAVAEANTYADETFVTLADLPGQLDDYVPTSEKGQALGVATLDASGYVPASQLNIDVSGDISTAINALTTDDIEEGSESLYFTNERAIDAVSGVDIYPNAVVINNVSKNVATTATVASASTVSGLTWAKAGYRSAKLLVKAATATNSQVSEILVTLDSSDNVAVTEFAIVDTGSELATVTADVSGTDVRILVTTLGSATTVTVFGTLLV